MATDSASNEISEHDHLSKLADALLLTILSLLPIDMAARTSVLSRRFRHLWEASPSLNLISRPEKNFLVMADGALLRRDPSCSLHSLRIDLENVDGRSQSTSSFDTCISSLLSKAYSLDLNHLTIQGFKSHCVSSLLRVLLSMDTLKSLSFDTMPFLIYEDFEDGKFPPPPSKFTLSACLTSLSLTLFMFDPPILDGLLSQLSSLKDLQLLLTSTPKPGIRLSSRTITKLKLIIHTDEFRRVQVPIELCFPAVELFHLTIKGSHTHLHHCHGKLPLLKKAVISLDTLRVQDVASIHRLLKFISRVEDLALHLKQSEDEIYPIPILLEPGKDAPNFFNLKWLDVTACFHRHNLEALVNMLHHSPHLESLNLLHEVSKSAREARGRKRKPWQSKLPRNDDGNCCYGYFRNLHLGDNRKRFMELISKKCVSL